ncbi:hypothetical protein [Microvirga vignae]|uniref:hypothetical protein n=1 Tax=Microvirga vignae TaxID=1225564 RepID=UPI001237616E|nr:hypothetical protein [Microvirga vignae]
MKSETKAALRDVLATDPALAGFDTSQWSFTERSYRSRDIVQRFAALMRHDLPGKQPRLTFFLDRAVFSAPIGRMEEAWKGSGEIAEFPDTPAAMDSFFSIRRGQTIIVVSHVEDGDFSLNYGTGSRISIAAARDAAARHGVFLVPVGCNTLTSGAPFGFTRNISTEQVEIFLRHAASASTFAALFNALAQVGSLQIDIAPVVGLLTALVRDTSTLSDAISVEIPREVLSNVSGWDQPPVNPDKDGKVRLFVPQLIHPINLPFPITAFVWLWEWALVLLARSNWMQRIRERSRWLPAVLGACRVLRIARWVGIYICMLVALVWSWLMGPWPLVIMLVMLGFAHEAVKNVDRWTNGTVR